MSGDAVHDEVESLLGAYALDAVDDRERELVESHLERCPRCRAEVDAFMEVAAALGNSIDPVPAELWARIAGRLDLSAPGDATLLEIRARARQQIAGFAPRRVGAGATAVPARWQRRALVGLAAAAAVALALVSLSLSNANSKVEQLQALAASRGAGAAAEAALADPAHRLVELRGAGGAQLATVVVSPTGTGYLLASHLAPLAATKTYQLWARIDSRPISLGLLGPRPARDAAFRVGTAATALLVTVEPAGGTARPSGSAVALGPVNA